MDLDPTPWVIIIIGATAVGGVIMWWGTKPKKKR